MVQRQLRGRGIGDAGVLAAMGRVPRHAFVDAAYLDQAYADHPLPIGGSQTISQPYMVARMTELCRPTAACRALEVGAGCGYQSAVLAQLCQHVYAMELVPDLAQRCRQTLQALEIDNVTVSQGDGTHGWQRHGPFDVILVAAAAPSAPTPLLEQLADGGRMVLPVGSRAVQMLQVVTRHGERLDVEQTTPCRFVALLGEHGWDQ